MKDWKVKSRNQETKQIEKISREDYLKALSKCISSAKRPTLIHVNAYQDLPNEDEIELPLISFNQESMENTLFIITINKKSGITIRKQV